LFRHSYGRLIREIDVPDGKAQNELIENYTEAMAENGPL